MLVILEHRRARPCLVARARRSAACSRERKPPWRSSPLQSCESFPLQESTPARPPVPRTDAPVNTDDVPSPPNKPRLSPYANDGPRPGAVGIQGSRGTTQGHLGTHRTYPCDTRPKSTTLLLEDVAIRCVGHTRGRDEGRGVRSPRWIGVGGARRKALRFLGSRSFPCFRGRSCSRRCSCSRARSSARGRTQARGVA